MIDDGTNKFPFTIFKTSNDGQEFLPDVNSKQKIKIIPYNGCKEGDVTPAISKNVFPNGYYRNQNKK